ncbi:MAG: hypothetical protein KAT62_00655 [Desulfuromonadales bacterium]|nr:hypothetical protein [Desulfuromonadales bacterium]
MKKITDGKGKPRPSATCGRKSAVERLVMPTFTYAVEQRLRFIDFLLHQYGTLNRSAMVDFFGISEPCATRDIQKYIELVPANAVYDKTAKTYVRGADFRRVWA